ncbi:methyltransferase [Amycolatopsis sp. cmx-4-61]|uniref:methyltransferase n=1 Tax=Amycolatopsis sp. cmx-4-61 TaxID=2790937 RepID=UPI00397A1936
MAVVANTSSGAGDDRIAPVTTLRELALAAAAPAALRAAVRIGVAEALGDTPVPVDQLAKKLEVDVGVLERLLRNLSCYGIFTDTADGVVHTPTSALLHEEHPQSLKYWVLWVTEPWTWELWPHLEHAVRHGGQGLFEDLHGSEFFAHLHRVWPESTEVFNRSQTELSRITSASIANTLNLRDVKTIADVGGGRGYNLAVLLETNPHLEGVLVDLPAVVANPDPRLRPGGALSSRVRVMAGDCLEGIPVEADVYLFKSILEWDDERTVTALRNAVAAGRPGGKVLVVTNLVDDSPEVRYATGIDLLFLLNTNGKRHTMKGITRLVERSGLRLESVRPIKPLLHLVEASIPR